MVSWTQRCFAVAGARTHVCQTDAHCFVVMSQYFDGTRHFSKIVQCSYDSSVAACSSTTPPGFSWKSSRREGITLLDPVFYSKLPADRVEVPLCI